MSTESINLSLTSLAWWTWAGLGLLGIALTAPVLMRHYRERTMPGALPGIFLSFSIGGVFAGVTLSILPLPAWGQWVLFAAACHLVANELQAPLARFLRDRALAQRRFPVLRG